MLRPSLDELYLWLILVVMTLTIWIWNIYKYKGRALLFFGTILLSFVLIFSVGTHWSSVDRDRLLAGLLIVDLAVASIIPRSLRNLPVRHVVISLIVVLALLTFFQVSLRDNLKLYLTMRLSSD